MLLKLKIANLALIEKAEVEFDPAFNVITGESGAGKSILMGGIGLLLGARSDKGVIRTGCDRCEVSAELSLTPGAKRELQKCLQNADLSIDLESNIVTLRRVITNSGSRNYFCDEAISGKLLRELSGCLIDLQNPDDQLSLNSRSRQLALLDAYLGNAPLQQACAQAAGTLKTLEKAKADLLAGLPSDAAVADARETVAAIDAVNPVAGEVEDLENRHQLSANRHQILTISAQLVNLLTESDNSLIDHFGEANRLLGELAHFDTVHGSDLVASGDIISDKLRDLSADLERFASEIDLDEEAFAALESRLSNLYTLCRHYGPTLEQVLAKRDEAQQLIDNYDSSSRRRDAADQAIRDQQQKLQLCAQKLSNARRQNAAGFINATLAQLQAIGFGQCALEAHFDTVETGGNGMDDLDLLFCANRGEALHPLRQIASSGERSRLFLALKTVLAAADEIPVVIFDEIDVNIGGETANKVARALHKLGKSRQILCISHLVQVASQADAHFVVSKHEADGRTASTVRCLTAAEIVPELARMLGNTQGALAHAATLVNAKDLK